MTTILSYAPGMQFDNFVDAVPNSSDEASTDSADSPIDYSQFQDTFLNDLQLQPGQSGACFDLDFDLGFQVPDLSIPPTWSHNAPLKEVSSTPLCYLEASVAASVEALKASAPEGYGTKQHAPVKKMMKHEKHEDDRVVRRRTKNREAAQASRLRKRMRLETLESLVAEQKSITHAIVVERDNMMRENATLRTEIEYLKQALRSSMDGLKGLDADQLFAQVDLGY
jgi:hypothetical protein